LVMGTDFLILNQHGRVHFVCERWVVM